MRAWALAALLVLPASAIAKDDYAELFAPIAACLDAHAPDVERAIEDLNAAAVYLVDRICVVAVNERNIVMEKRLRRAEYEERVQRCAALDPNSRDYERRCPPEDRTDDPQIVVRQSMASFLEDRAAPDVKAYAARRLLELRIERLKAEDAGSPDN